MQGDRPCPRCGQLIPIGHDECPHCAKPRGWWRVERETLLAGSIALLVALFAMTGVAAKLYHSERNELGQQWFAQGEVDLKAGRAPKALEDFRTALAYSPDSTLYRLRLAQALVASRRPEEARSHLLTLWNDEPGNSTVNLELARLAAARGDETDAVRYYHGAMYGVWKDNPLERQLQTRFELAEYLLRQNQKTQAQSELISLAAALPQNAALYAKAGGLMRKAGDRSRAMAAYKRALAISPHEHEAAAGAGETAFEMGDYGAAVTYLNHAEIARAATQADKDELATARLVLRLDPMAPRLSRAEADRRTLTGYGYAVARLNACLKMESSSPTSGQAQDDLQKLFQQEGQLKAGAKPAALRQNPDLRVTLMDFVSSVEDASAKECGTPSGADLALLLIARKHGAAVQ